MSPELRSYLLAEHVVGAAIINLLLNAAIAWLSFRHLDVIPLWGAQSIGGDLLGTTVILPLLTCLIVTRIVRWHIRKGRVQPLAPSGASLAALGSSSQRALGTLPDGLFARGLTLGLLLLVSAGPILIGLLYLSGVSSLGLRDFVIFKGIAAAVMAAIVQPLIALRALMDRPLPAEALA